MYKIKYPVHAFLIISKERVTINEVPIVEFGFVKKILKRSGKTDVAKTGNNHYLRKIGNQGIIEKVMVALPENKP